MHRSVEIGPFKPKRNIMRQYCDECEEEETTKEALIEMQDFVAVRRFCDKCITTAKFDFAVA
jgi:hypothetical protein